MSDPFIGEIIMFGGNFAPRGWSFCDGNLLAISQHTALFSILGTTYGGDGRTTFALPELRGRVAMHAGSGPGLTAVRLGQKAGAETTQLTTAQLPSHNHAAGSLVMRANTAAPDGEDPTNATLCEAAADIYNEIDTTVNMRAGTIGGNTANTGGNQAFDNHQPYTAVNFIIALVGTFPSRS